MNCNTVQVNTLLLEGESTVSPFDRTRHISSRWMSIELNVPYDSSVKLAAASAVAPWAGSSGVRATTAL
jgi:hypothetical protein